MSRKSARAKRLAILRDELLARNQLKLFQRRGEPPPDSLKDRLREASLSSLLEKLGMETTIVDGENRIALASAGPEVQDIGASVALICSKLDLVRPTPPQTSWKLNGVRFLCGGQNFAAEAGVKSRFNTPATGFLVGDSGRYMLTAKHVAVDNFGRLRPRLYCIFGYREGSVAAVQSFPASDVVPITRLVVWGRGINEDWALVELEVSSGRAGLPLRTSGAPLRSDPVIAIGYPHGLPVKTGTGALRDVSSSLYEADLDIGAGNSGSPVIAVDGSGKPLYVEGIVVRAIDDLMFVEGKGCSVWVNSSSPDQQDYWASFTPITKVLADPVFQKTVLHPH
jgi:hypothetical protein